VGNQIYFFANGKPINDTITKSPLVIEDSALTEGMVGLGVMSFSGGKVFDEFEWFSTDTPK
jgi:hypothetical protein